jgi:chromosomal replication initiation ATPase DnaA
MSQIPLRIIPRRSFSTRNFVVHAGVRNLIDQAVSYCKQSGFRFLTIQAEPVGGLTHLSILLAEMLTEQGYYPRIIEGEHFFDWANKRLAQNITDADEVVIVDDAERYLQHIAAHDSGQFVSLVELLRVNRAAIILLTHLAIDVCGCDGHVLSRSRAGLTLKVAAPEPEDLPQLIATMATQRGMNISARNQEFLSKRLPRDINRIDQYLERAQQLAQASGQGFKLSLLSEAIEA